jgi:hypothetical protein
MNIHDCVKGMSEHNRLCEGRARTYPTVWTAFRNKIAEPLLIERLSFNGICPSLRHQIYNNVI